MKYLTRQAKYVAVPYKMKTIKWSYQLLLLLFFVDSRAAKKTLARLLEEGRKASR